MNRFWKGKKVFVTGHTGFKGAWLTIWLNSIGAKVYGYSLAPTTSPSLYELAQVENLTEHSYIQDVRELSHLQAAIREVNPDIILHLAAQALVIDGYEHPVETFATNVMGTVHVLEAARFVPSVKAIVNVTTDKCYENQEWVWGYRENDRLGGRDPYSNSKACSELVTSSYINSFYPPNKYEQHGVAVATARAGNVIGGGDWSENRLIPDLIKAIIDKEEVNLRNPVAIRPWQHVLEPLGGYLRLAELLYKEGITYCGAWNFGPNDGDYKDVVSVSKKLVEIWGSEIDILHNNKEGYHEAQILMLDCSKAKRELKWQPRWNLNRTLHSIVEWNKSFIEHGSALECCLHQIKQFEINLQQEPSCIYY